MLYCRLSVTENPEIFGTSETARKITVTKMFTYVVKRKIVPVNSINTHGYGIGDIAPIILNLDASLRSVVSFATWPY